jgi:ATP phosphoribosyltransferase regulatory subunit
VAGLQTTDARKHALLRHVWRPNRFKALLEQFSGRKPVPASRRALLSAKTGVAIEAPMIGLRSRDAIQTRIDHLHQDAIADPLSNAEVDLLDAILQVRDRVPQALASLRDIATQMPALTPSLDRLEARMAAVMTRGIAVETLDFEASYGRTSMEYYDGFVFGFYAEGRSDLPPVALGGRYDALTLRLGQGREIPAVGGVIRPDLMLNLGADA